MRLKYFSSYNHCYQQEKHIDSISNTNQHDILQYGELVKKKPDVCYRSDMALKITISSASKSSNRPPTTCFSKILSTI